MGSIQAPVLRLGVDGSFRGCCEVELQNQKQHPVDHHHSSGSDLEDTASTLFLDLEFPYSVSAKVQ